MRIRLMERNLLNLASYLVHLTPLRIPLMNPPYSIIMSPLILIGAHFSSLAINQLHDLSLFKNMMKKRPCSEITAFKNSDPGKKYGCPFLPLRSGCFQKQPITLISLKQAGNSVSEQGFDWKQAFQAGFYENAGFQAQNRLYKFGHSTAVFTISRRRWDQNTTQVANRLNRARATYTGRQLPPLSSVLYGIVYKRCSVVAAQVLLREKSDT